jgi:hypothetical protein
MNFVLKRAPGVALTEGKKLVEMVRMKGLEPPRLSALEPKSRASTNSATSASARQSHESHHSVNVATEMMFQAVLVADAKKS